MTKSTLWRWPILLALCVLLPTAAAAQEKVIKKTTDESGFERQLTEIDLMLQTASQLMAAGEWQEAAAELQKVVTAEPQRIEGWQELAKCYKSLKQFDKAAEAYEKAHELNPESLDLLSNLGYAQLNAAQLDAAVDTYNKMLAMDATNYDANVHLGFVYQQREEAEKAITYYEKALEGKPDDVTTLGSVAKLYADAGNIDKSVEMYQRAIAASTDAAQKKDLRSKLGRSLIAVKEYDKAAGVYAALVEAEPESAANQFNLGISLMQSKREKEAIPHLEKVVALRPDYGQAYQYLAQCYNGAGQYNKAIQTVQKGLASSTEKGGLYYTWGQSLEKLELYEEAIEAFQRCLSDPVYGAHAKKQIQRQEDLKKRAKMMRGQG